MNIVGASILMLAVLGGTASFAQLKDTAQQDQQQPKPHETHSVKLRPRTASIQPELLAMPQHA